MPDNSGRVRIDKWLWAARFFKTRSLATQAVESGKVQLNGERPKPAKEVRPGDRLGIRIGEAVWDIEIVTLSMQRGPAAVAQTLYCETPESKTRRAEATAQRNSWNDPSARLRGRPTKRNRRDIDNFKN